MRRFIPSGEGLVARIAPTTLIDPIPVLPGDPPQSGVDDPRYADPSYYSPDYTQPIPADGDPIFVDPDAIDPGLT